MRRNLTISQAFIIAGSLVKALRAQSACIITAVAGGGSYDRTHADNSILQPEAAEAVFT